MERNSTKWIRDKRNNCPEYKSYFNSLVRENKKLLKSRNKEFVNNLKANKPCELCGNKYENPECYDFDHVVPSDKKFSLSKVIRNSSLIRLSDEIKKCRLLCVNCHRIVHPSNADPFVRTNGKHNHRVRRNRIIIYEEKIKRNLTCMDCKGVFKYFQLDFDHRPEEVKVQAISRFIIKSRGLDGLHSELEKCDLVCAVCHRIRTSNRRGGVL